MEIGRSSPWGPERYQFNESYGDESLRVGTGPLRIHICVEIHHSQVPTE